MVKAIVKDPCLPEGVYDARFEGVEEVDHETYGSGWKWIFTVIDGPERGRKTFRTTKAEPTPGNSCGKFVGMLASVDPDEGLEIDTDNYVGNTYQVVVGSSGQNGNTRVESFEAVDDVRPSKRTAKRSAKKKKRFAMRSPE